MSTTEHPTAGSHSGAVPGLDLSGLSEPPLPPIAEGFVELADGRLLAFAEYGEPEGDVVIWCHGTPGARHQIPPDAPSHAQASGIRIVSPDRPGVGDSDNDPNRCLTSWAEDVEQLADHVGAETFAIAGLSGGGPHVLAVVHELPERATAGALLGGMVPLVGPDAPPSTPDFLPIAMDLAHRMRGPMGATMSLVLRQLTLEIGDKSMDIALRVLPDNDRGIIGSPGFREMFVNDLYGGSRKQFRAQAHDVSSFGRDWGFSPRDITVPVRSWHGTGDSLVPLAHMEHLVSLIPDARLDAFDDEGHFAGYARAPEVLDWLMENHRGGANTSFDAEEG